MNKPCHFVPSLVVAGALFLAAAPWPYGYYQLLRLATCAVSVYVAFLAYVWGKAWIMWVSGFIAFLFNPIFPVYLSREIWLPIDVICGSWFAFVAFILKQPEDGDE